MQPCALASHVQIPEWLLQAAIGRDDQMLANVHLHCLQLLGSEVVLP